MAYRGRVIFPFLAKIARLDTVTTAATDPDGGATAGYDDVFREPSLDTTTEQPVRIERPDILLPCQVETEEGPDDGLRMGIGGRTPGTFTRLVFHFQDLESGGLVDPDGNPSLRVNDRLVEIRTIDDELVQAFRTPLYATEVQSRSFGLSALTRNICLVTFEDRAKSV